MVYRRGEARRFTSLNCTAVMQTHFLGQLGFILLFTDVGMPLCSTPLLYVVHPHNLHFVYLLQETVYPVRAPGP